jgi:hypothetical protein
MLLGPTCEVITIEAQRAQTLLLSMLRCSHSKVVWSLRSQRTSHEILFSASAVLPYRDQKHDPIGIENHTALYNPWTLVWD